MSDRSADAAARPAGARLMGDAVGAAALFVLLAAALHLAAGL